MSCKYIKLEIKALAFAIFFIPLSLFSRQRTYEDIRHTNPPYIPWFTGALLPPPAVNAQPGHPVLAMYGAMTLTYGEYDNNWNLEEINKIYAINPFVEYLFGINDLIGIDIFTSFVSRYSNGKHATHLQDTTVRLGLELARDTPNSWIPDVRFIIQEVFPTGKYEKLDPYKNGIDATGRGSFQSSLDLVAQKLIPISSHFLLIKGSIGYYYPLATQVKGFNTYGGNQETKGKVPPSQRFLAFLSGEYSLSQRWVITLDSFFEYQLKSSFSGKSGSTELQNLDSKITITLAPEVEYNFSATSGLLFGIWASIAGKNTPAFASALLAYYYTF